LGRREGASRQTASAAQSVDRPGLYCISIPDKKASAVAGILGIARILGRAVADWRLFRGAKIPMGTKEIIRGGKMECQLEIDARTARSLPC
jgi:hypothetical protein